MPDDVLDSETMYFISRKGAELVKAAGLNKVSMLTGKTPLQLYTYALENKKDELESARKALNMDRDEMRSHLLNALQIFSYYNVLRNDPRGVATYQRMANDMPGVTEEMAYILYVAGYTDMAAYIPDRDLHVKDPKYPDVEISPVRIRTKEIYCDVLSKVIVDPDVTEKLWLTILSLVSQMEGEVGPPCHGVGPCG